MFVVARISDNVRLQPAEFALPRAVALATKLNAKYANKVLPDVGLCIRVLDIETCSEAVVHAVQDGSSQTKVVFRIIVFRPFRGEVLVGKVSSSSQRDGIRVSLDFFDDIMIPPANLPEGSEYDLDEGVWLWRFNGNAYYLDKDEPIRIKVESDAFHDSAATTNTKIEFGAQAGSAAGANSTQRIPSTIAGATNANTAPDTTHSGGVQKRVTLAGYSPDLPTENNQSGERIVAPYSIVASIYDSGFGLVAWWK